MEALKQVIEGHILQILATFQPHQNMMNEEEKKDIDSFKQCLNILQCKE